MVVPQWRAPGTTYGCSAVAGLRRPALARCLLRRLPQLLPPCCLLAPGGRTRPCVVRQRERENEAVRGGAAGGAAGGAGNA